MKATSAGSVESHLARSAGSDHLEDLVAPVSLEQFVGEYWTKRFVHIPGPASKFAHLFSWEVLNRSLEQHRFPTAHASRPRIALVKAGNTLPAGLYLEGDSVDGHRLMHELAVGATLVFNSCEEIHPPLRELCSHLERLFHVHVLVNVYAGWRADNGFEIHWDDQDTLILQIHGRKHWRIWAPTRTHPFKRDIVDTSPTTKPEGPPIWDGVLEQGGLLSVPRGWWHVAYPMDEPCLHLTVTVKNLNGIDLLQWFADQMKASEAARRELPLHASEDDQRAWLDTVWRDLAAAWTPTVLERYVAHVDARARPRPVLQLPDVDASATVIRSNTALQLATPRALRFETANGTARFSAGGVDWQAASELVPALARFNDGLAHTVAELGAGGAALIPLLTALVMKGVLRSVAP